MRIEVNGDVVWALKKLDRKLREAGLFLKLKAESEARSKSERKREKHERALRRHRRRDRKLAQIKEGLIGGFEPWRRRPLP